jgi:hypothetical protein
MFLDHKICKTTTPYFPEYKILVIFSCSLPINFANIIHGVYIYIYILFLPFGNKFQQLKLWNRDFKESPQLDPQLNLTRPQLLVITPHILLLLHGVNYAKILHCKWFLHIFLPFYSQGDPKLNYKERFQRNTPNWPPVN